MKNMTRREPEQRKEIKIAVLAESHLEARSEDGVNNTALQLLATLAQSVE